MLEMLFINFKDSPNQDDEKEDQQTNNKNLVATPDEKIQLGLSEFDNNSEDRCKKNIDLLDIIFTNSYLKNEIGLKIMQTSYDAELIECMLNVKILKILFLISKLVNQCRAFPSHYYHSTYFNEYRNSCFKKT